MFVTRVYRDLTNCLDTACDFSSVVSLVNSLESQKSKPTQQPAYNRYDQENFHDPSSNALGIKTGMSFNGLALKELDSFRAGKPTAGPSKTAISRKRSCPFGSSGVQRKKRTPKTPIIIVPPAGTSMISTLNVKEILEEYRFVSTNEKKRCTSLGDSETLIFRRKDDNTSVPYRIVENPVNLTAAEWERVVAVFVQGREWQFKDWQWNANPTEIFSRICAFHFKFDHAKLNPNIAKWNCEILNLSKSKRHLDKAVVRGIWQKIDQFICRNRPNLRS